MSSLKHRITKSLQLVIKERGEKREKEGGKERVNGQVRQYHDASEVFW